MFKICAASTSSNSIPFESSISLTVASEELSSSGDASQAVQHISQKSPVGQAILGRIVVQLWISSLWSNVAVKRIPFG